MTAAEVLATADQVEIASVLARCGCGEHDTKVRIGGAPWWWVCFVKAGNPPPEPMNLRLLADLQRPEYAPRRQSRGTMTDPFWRPPLAAVDDLVHSGQYRWQRPHEGLTVKLDRSGAFFAAAASVRVAWGPLEDAGSIPWAGKPGYYKVAYFDWSETGTPHPLGGAAVLGKRDGAVWVTHNRVKLLADLAAAGRWPELGDMPAWVNDHAVALDRWATHAQTLRRIAIEHYGRDSVEYEAVKRSFSTALSLMKGKKQAGRGRDWDKSPVWRADWSYAIEDLSACTMWRWCDDLAEVAHAEGCPELAPVAIQNADELVVPLAAVELFTSAERSRGRKPLQLDPTGIKLGTFKAKP